MESVTGRLAAGAATLLLAMTAACATTTSGTGAGGGGVPAPTQGDSGQPAPARSSLPPVPTESKTRPPVRHGVAVTVTGLNSRTVYHAQVYGASKVTDCAAHSYGAPMINYFQSHPCVSATRRIFTIPLNGRTVALSSVAVIAAPGPGNDYYKWAGKFVKLEKSNGTGSVNDLLREGYRIPGAGDSIPNREAFDVIGQDDVVTVLDAWYLQGSTRDQEPDLIRLEEDLFLTALTNPKS
jgi:hypothetical protein